MPLRPPPPYHGLALILILAASLLDPTVLSGGDAPARRKGRSKPADQTPSHYLGEWVDGSRLSGDVVAPWHETKSMPELAGRPLFDEKRPIRWLLEDTLLMEAPPTSRIELVGGDVIPGRVIGAGTGAESPTLRLPPYLEVAPYVPVDWPEDPARTRIRVTIALVRRIVWQPVTRQYRPQTLFYRDGRQLDFRAVRFTASAIQLLRADGIQEVSLEEAGELHMPNADSWEAYLDQLAVISPDGAARLVELETASWLRVTSSADRFQARSRGGSEDPKRWYHLLQPSWSLDAFWVQHRAIRLRRFFLPHEVPLSRIEPVVVRQEADLGGPWPWRVDRNVEGGPLVAGGQLYAWGFGVHAMSELEFLLPPLARSFQSRLGLDQIAGEGGCVRATVYLGTSGGKPAYENGPILGSGDTFTTGRLALESPGQTPKRLFLHVDVVRQGRPAAADPFGIRASFDWLEPLVELDAEKLKSEVLRRGPQQIPAWQGWKVVTEGREGARLVNYWDEVCSRVPVYRLLASSPRGSLTLSSKLRIGPGKDQLLLAVWRPPQSTPSRIEVRIDGKPIQREGKGSRFEVPTRNSEKPPQPLRISLAEFPAGQVLVELTQQSDDDKGLVQWDAISLAASPIAAADKGK